MGLFIFALLLIAGGLVAIAVPSLVSAKKSTTRIGSLGAIALGVLLLISSMVVVIDAGEVGAVIIFGKVQKTTLQNGLHLIPPYADIVKYPIRLQQVSMTGDNAVEIRVKNDLSIKLDSTVYYYVNPKEAGNVYKFVAKSINQLQNNILVPIIRSEIRNVGSQYRAEEIYSTKRAEVTKKMKEAISNNIRSKGVILKDFLIREVRLPDMVDRTIQLKISAQQEADAMEFKKLKAQKEAEIKIIEAKGLAKAQRIINSTLSPNYLQHEAIMAYEKLAGSSNTTFVILPTSSKSTGMPLILNASK